MQNKVPDGSVAGESERGGVGLSDLILMISGGWALPYAVMAVMGNQSPWRIPAYLIGGVGGLLWGWYFRVLGPFLYRKLHGQQGTSPATPPFPTIFGIYLGMLSLSFLLQYALYRLIRFALGIALPPS